MAGIGSAYELTSGRSEREEPACEASSAHFVSLNPTGNSLMMDWGSFAYVPYAGIVVPVCQRGFVWVS